MVLNLVGNTANFSVTPLTFSVLAFAIYQNQCIARRTLVHLVYTGHLLYWQWGFWLESLLNLETDDC